MNRLQSAAAIASIVGVSMAAYQMWSPGAGPNVGRVDQPAGVPFRPDVSVGDARISLRDGDATTVAGQRFVQMRAEAGGFVSEPTCTVRFGGTRVVLTVGRPRTISAQGQRCTITATDSTAGSAPGCRYLVDCGN